MAPGRRTRDEGAGADSAKERRRFLYVLAVLLASGLTDCAGRSEPPPDPTAGTQQPADPSRDPEPPPVPAPDPEPPPDPGPEPPPDPGSKSPPDPGPGPEPECMSNADVRELVASGEVDAAIIARLSTSETCFDISSAAMLNLRQAGVSPRVIQAMTAAARREEH